MVGDPTTGGGDKNVLTTRDNTINATGVHQ